MNKFLMRNMLDKAFLLGLCFMIFLNQAYQSEMVIFVLVTIMLSGLIWVTQKPKFSFLCILFLLIATTKWPEYAYFVPVLFYDGMIEGRNKILLLNSGLIVVFFIYNSQYSTSLKLYILLLCALSSYLAFLTAKDSSLRKDYLWLEQEKDENNFTFKTQNSELIKQQEIKVNLELSSERNRIARDIHDNVGHLLSSALLQTGALKAMNQEEKLALPLKQLQETITEGMNSIRDSVHDLYDESLSLSLVCQNILLNFTFCEVEIVGDFSESIRKEYKLACIMLIKEALANVMKHSNANKVTITFKNHPGFYKLTIEDNGTKNEEKNPNEIGIGLIGMQERMTKLKGRLSYHQKKESFLLIAILPK